MSLAQVVYNISTDSDFAAHWSRDPEEALKNKGFKLSREEFAFLSTGLSRKDGDKVRLSDLAVKASGWPN
jgi:hypothetical protein